MNIFDPATERAPSKGLVYVNGLGGFSRDGATYTISLEKGQTTPAPWANVISNPDFGFIVSESGGGFTWCGNSRENKLTPWSNDPICDPPGEVFYLRDETHAIWSVTPLPIREEESYRINHGFGYTEFHHMSHGISQSLVQFVPVEGTVKISLLTLKNDCPQERSLTMTYYVSPVLGVSTSDTAMHLVSSQTDRGALVIENPYNREFPDQVCYMDVSVEERTVTGDRREFFGIGTPVLPEALCRVALSGTVGAGFDPCGAIQVEIRIPANETREIVFLLGVAKDSTWVHGDIDAYITVSSAKSALGAIKKFWMEKLQVIQVKTPDPSMNFMLNGWLLYQVISCRMWARSGFYQSGGAFGFRDQLQDSLSLALIWPELARKQILKHSAHQFLEGDVLHWWHEPTGKGTRTRISDDYLWLPHVTAEYIRITGDSSILDEVVPFLEEEVLKPHEDERYCTPKVSESSASIYDHCIRALEHGLRFGERGIPLMGCGDWNDGMNTVGNQGKGESIWLGWFLCDTLKKFIPICMEKRDEDRAQRYVEIGGSIAKALEEYGWDGNWYRRAYFDNGAILGSANNRECKIDSLAQTWAVLSGVGSLTRAVKAMESLEDYLVLREEGLIKLLTPPFTDGELEPGYIKGYVPGVRENGGQYTHAAAWVISAFATLGDGDKAGELFGLINPINHTRTNRETAIYRVEPYVMAADVYGDHPHVGRGGWTWYTGSANWMYKAGVEDILGFKKTGNRLRMDPCIPAKWKSVTLNYRYMQTDYEIMILNPDASSKGVIQVKQDGEPLSDTDILLVNDSRQHTVEVLMGTPAETVEGNDIKARPLR